jgi:hypothetical protein
MRMFDLLQKSLLLVRFWYLTHLVLCVEQRVSYMRALTQTASERPASGWLGQTLMRRSSTWEDWKEARASSADKALYLFGSDSALRLRCACLVQSSSYNAFVATATVADTLFIIVSPQTASTSDHWAEWQLIVTVVNIAFAAVFILDSVVNVISTGLVAYWRTDIFCKIGM